MLLEIYKYAILKQYINKTVRLLKSSFSDLIGMILLSNDNIEPTKVKSVEEAPVKSNYETLKELKGKDLQLKEIATITGLALQTLRNYQVKYNKELQII